MSYFLNDKKMLQDFINFVIGLKVKEIYLSLNNDNVSLLLKNIEDSYVDSEEDIPVNEVKNLVNKFYEVISDKVVDLDLNKDIKYEATYHIKRKKYIINFNYEKLEGNNFELKLGVEAYEKKLFINLLSKLLELGGDALSLEISEKDANIVFEKKLKEVKNINLDLNDAYNLTGIITKDCKAGNLIDVNGDFLELSYKIYEKDNKVTYWITQKKLY